MESEHVVLHIMTDIKSSRSNIAANFQNAIAAQLLPPIGVFWDIENIQVPKGKSASALVNAIRERFFKRHREAEFMCVCDINKENKSIIHELNDAQVTVVHVDATSKNAADEKLRQCMRRFVDTHGTPATLLLISDDVNFATDLSDFRHRHHIRIVLLHRNHAPEPLLACAHEHHNFSELTMDLPWRSPQKVLNNRPRDLIVTDLPANSSVANIKKCLRRLSDNCGGKVARVSRSKAIISFANADAAERAQKRMDKELVYGQKVSVNFLQPDTSDFKDYILRRNLFKDNNSVGGPSGSSGSSRDSSPHCDRQESCNEDSKSEFKKPGKPFIFPAPPVFDHHNLPSILQSSPSQKTNHHSEFHSSSDSCTNNEKFELFSSKNNKKYTTLISESMNALGNVQENHFFPREDVNSHNGGLPKNIGRVSPFLMQDGNVKSAWLPLENSQMNQSVAQKNTKTQSGKQNQCSLFHVCPTAAPGLSMNFNNLSKECEVVNSTLQQNNCATSVQSENGHSIGKSDPSVCKESSPVDLFVTNLDQTVEINEMKRTLQRMFREHVMVIHISMLLQPDGNLKAMVKVPSLQDAQYAISQLQRRKIGHKRILISHVTNDRNPPFSVLKSEVVSLLKDIPSKHLPVFKFREMYEKRYNRAISVSEIYKMRDAVIVQEDVNGRMVSLNMEYRNTPSPTDSDSIHSQELPVLEKPYCELHFHPSKSQGWAEQQGIAPLPDVFISLKSLSPAVHTLLDSHQGSLPLNSFCACFEADIGPLPIVNASSEESLAQFSALSVSSETKAGRSLPSRGIPLEHLISCVAGVEIVKSRLCVKKVQWCENRSMNQPAIRSISPALAGPLAVFGREMMDLLKNQPRCIVLFNKFIPVYHHHFGRQCRVADYGFTKLIDLLEAIPHIIQVLGDGQTRLVTLTHRMQVKRFAADLLRILKARASKQLALSEFPVLYEQSTEKIFDITNYGVCDVHDMLAEVSENAVVVTHSGEDTLIAIPKREQTKEEIEKTKSFSSEVIELLKHTPTCSMSFNKFIPAYHHHFGKQCRVADYGFSKLIELFEAIPIIEVVGTGEDKIVNLTEKERNEILADRLLSVIKAQPNKMIALHMLGPAYVEMHGHVLRPADFGAVDMPDLLRKLGTSLKIVEGYAGAVVALVDSDFISQVSLRMRRLLMEQKEGQMAVEKLNCLYQKRFGHSIDLGAFQTELENVIKVDSGIVKLTPLQLYARDMMLAVQGSKMPMTVLEFESAFFKHFGVSLQPSAHGFSSTTSMLLSLKEYFSLMKRRKKSAIQLNRENCGSPLTVMLTKDDRNMSQNSHFVSTQECSASADQQDILNEPIPSCIPSPALAPQSMELDLMGFETPLPISKDTASSPSDHSDSNNSGKQQGSHSMSHALLPPVGINHNLDVAPTLGNFTYLPPYNNLLPCSGISSPSLAYYFIPEGFRNRMTQHHAAAFVQQSTLLPVHAVIPGTESLSCNMQVPVSSASRQLNTGTPSASSEPLTLSQTALKSEIKDCVSPCKMAKLSSKDGSQTSLSGRKSGASRIAAQFSNPLEL